MRTGLLCTFVLLCCVAASALLRAQNTPPPQAQAELDRGLAAAEQKQWDLAIKHLAEAQNTAKTSPQVLYNLGLAHDKAGHELAALAWLQAYLAAAPRAANADAIRKEIVRLDVATEAKINTLAKLAMDAVNKMPGPSGDKAYFLGHLSEVYEAIGDFNAAYAAWIVYQPKGRARALRDHAIRLAESGDMDGAASTASQIPASLRGIVTGDLDEYQLCKKDVNTCNIPVRPDDYWNSVWFGALEFYADRPFFDTELALQASRQLKRIQGHDAEETFEGTLIMLDEAANPVFRPMSQAARWADFAGDLSRDDIVVNLDAALTKNAKGDPTRLLIAAEDAPAALKKRLNQARNLEAQLKRHGDPQDMLGMGRAQDKAGHELAALAWLHAYLAAQPAAANAGEIRQQFARLEAAAETRTHALVQAALDAAGKMPSSADRKDMRAHVSHSYACIGDLKTALALRKEFEPKREVNVWRDYVENLAESGNFEGAVQAAGHIPEALRGVVEEDLNGGYCKLLGLNPAAPANPDRYWNDAWTDQFNFYFDFPLEDLGLARQVTRQFKPPVDSNDLLVKPELDKLEKAEHENWKPDPTAVRWVEFALQLSASAEIAELRAAWKLPAKDDLTQQAIKAADAPCKQMELLNKIRALDRQNARQQAGPSAVAGVAP